MSDTLVNQAVVSFVTVGELLQGAHDKNEITAISKLLEIFEIDYGSSEVFMDALELVKNLYPKFGLQFLDSIIAATSLKNGYILMTSDKKHFSIIVNLDIA